MPATALAIPNQIPDHEIIIYESAPPEHLWLRYFNLQMAMEAFAAHVASLPSSRTPEKHTWAVYSAGLHHFLNWLNNNQPTADLLQRYIATLVTKGLKSSTIGSKYLAPVRLFLKKLASQNIDTTDMNEFMFVANCREHMRQAAAMPTPKPETISNIAPLWRSEFKRLNVQQVNAVLRQIDRTTLIGLRDYALLHIAFSTGLRLSELHRITLASIKAEGDVYLLTVRGKRSNIDPVPLAAAAYKDLRAWVDTYNDGLDFDDPRRIAPSSPVWQPLVHGGHYVPVGLNGFNPDRGISNQGLRDAIRTRTAAALGDDWGLAAHDTRRTAAAIAYDAGMPLTDIQSLLRHKNAAITLNYVGTKPDFAARSLSTYVQFG